MSTLTVDIPAEVYKQLAEEARRAGKSVEDLTRELLENALGACEKPGAHPDPARQSSAVADDGTRTEDRFRRNQAYFEQRKQDLQTQYGDHFIAVWEEGVIDHDADRSRLAERVYKQLGSVPIYIDQPSASPARFYVSSPTLG